MCMIVDKMCAMQGQERGRLCGLAWLASGRLGRAMGDWQIDRAVNRVVLVLTGLARLRCGLLVG